MGVFFSLLKLELYLAGNGLGFRGLCFGIGKFHRSSVGGIVSTPSSIVRGEALIDILSMPNVVGIVGTEKGVGCPLHAFALRPGHHSTREARHERATRVEWWRRGESNPRPNKSHSSFYVCSQALKDSPPPLPPVRATLVARILLVLAPPPASPGLAPACYRRLYPLTSFKVET